MAVLDAVIGNSNFTDLCDACLSPSELVNDVFVGTIAFVPVIIGSDDAIATAVSVR